MYSMWDPGRLGVVWTIFTNPLTVPINRSPWDHPRGAQDAFITKFTCFETFDPYAFALFIHASFTYLRTFHFRVWGQNLLTLTPNTVFFYLLKQRKSLDVRYVWSTAFAFKGAMELAVLCNIA
jgi:hypothetical protein